MEVLQRLHNRGSVSTGYDIDNSVKLEPANSENFSRTPSSNGNQQIFTFSSWVKFNRINSGVSQWSTIFGAGNFATNSPSFRISHNTNNSLQVSFYTNSQYTGYYRTNAFHRDTTAWYHFVCAIDTTQGTNTNRVKMYVNGVLAPATSVVSHISQNYNSGVNTGIVHRVGAFNNTADSFVSEYVAETHFVDGQALAPTEFGEFDDDSGIWKPKRYTGSYGTNGFYLDYADASDLGDDESGNGNDFAENNIAAADQATDTPTNNFCTFNPLMTQNNSPTISEGATKSTGGGGTWNQTWGNIGVKNGKWYYEFKVTNTSSTGYFGASTAPAEGSNTTGASLMYNTSFMLGAASRIDYYYWQNGSQVSNESTGWGTISTNDIIGIALDLDSSTKKFIVYKNGSALNGSGTDLPTNMQDEFIFPLYVQYENRADEANFGGYTTMTISSAASDGNGHGTFEIAPPTGYYAICTKNLAEYG